MPTPGYVNMAVTENAKSAIETLIIALTTKYQRRFTISQAIEQAASDLRRELELAGR